jgi:ADP-heptose:LPS heptosyltransferase
LTEPITDAGDHKNRTSRTGSILVNFFEAHNVGHVVEALHYCLGHHKANPGSRLSVLLNALAPTELARLCPFVEAVYPVELPGYPVDTSGLSEADCLAALREVPREWDYVVDNPRRGVEAHLRAVPGFARYYETSDQHFRARKARVTAGTDPPGYVPRGHLRLEPPAENRLRVQNIIPSGTPRIAVLPGGSSERWLYPSTTSWQIILRALERRFPEASLCLVGKLRADGRTSTSIEGADVRRLREACSNVTDLFDLPLLDQLAAVEVCDVFISPHSGFGMAALAVGTPWLTISGGRWPEYFFNGVPFYSLLPDPDHFPAYSQFGELPVLEEDADGEGPRTPTMSRERILADLDELLQATKWLAEGRLEYREALRSHFERFLRLHGGDRSTIYTIDNVHSDFV